MAITFTAYNSYKKALFDKSIDHTNDTLKVALTTSSYTPNIDTHDNFDDITNEVTGTGYTAGGFTLAGKFTQVDTTDNEGVFDANDLTNTTTTISNARYAILYKDTGVASTSLLIGYWDLEQNYSSIGGDFSFNWNAEGILNIN